MKEQDLKLKIAELKDTIVFLRKQLQLNKDEIETLFKKYSSYTIGEIDNYEFLMNKEGFTKALNELKIHC